MAKLSIQAGATSQSVNIFIQNSSSTTGAGLTGLAYNSGSLIAYYTFTGANCAATAITLATLSTVGSAWATGGFKEIDSTHMPGLYRLDIPNAALATSSGQSVTIYLSGATNMAPCVLEIELTAVNNQSTGFGLVDVSSNVVQIAGSAVSTSSAQLGVNLVNIAGSAVSTTTAQLGVNAVQVNGQTTSAAGTVTFPGTIASPTNITAGTITTVTNLTNAPTSGDLTATMKSSVTTAASAATPVASLSGDLTSTMKTSVQTASAAAITAAEPITANVTQIRGTNAVGAAGYMGVDWGAVANGTTTNNLSGTSINQVGSVSGSVGSVSGSVGSVSGNVTGSVASVTNQVTANMTAVNGNSSAASNVAYTMASIVRGTVGVGSTPTNVVATITTPSTATDASQFLARTMLFDYNTITPGLQGQVTVIQASTTGATPQFTVLSLTESPVAGDTFSII